MVGLVLLGLGWSAATIAGSTLLAEVSAGMTASSSRASRTP